jgi:hypothetical protein
VPITEAVARQLGVLAQVFDDEPQVIRLFDHGQEFGGLLQADLPVGRTLGGPADLLVHAVENRPGEVRLGVRQPLGVVRAGRLGEGEIPLPLQVVTVDAVLPAGPVLQEEPGDHLHKRQPLSRQRLLFF